MHRSVILAFAAAAVPTTGAAQTWAEVRGGESRLDAAVLADIKGNLRAKVLAASAGKDRSLKKLEGYLVQYRVVSVSGNPVVELHGSCDAPSGFDVHSEFYDERVSDGGECYFTVMFTISSRRFSNVIFHGYA